MAKELSEAEKDKRERLTAEREEKKLARQAEKQRQEREELERLNAQLRAARKAKRKAAADDLRNKGSRFFSVAETGLKQTVRKADALYNRAAAALSRFSARKISLPILIVIAFFGFWFTAYVGGHNLFHLQTKMLFTFYQFYLCDFSAGFCSHVIVGAVTTLFLDKVSIAQMTAIANAAVIVSFVLFALIIGLVLRKGLRERAFVPVLLAAVLLFEPIIVQSNYLFLGTLDVYVLILFLCILCTYGTPLFYFAAPVGSALAMVVHYHYLFSFFPAVMALFLYDMFLGPEKRKRVRGTVGFGVTAVTSGSLFLYFVFFAKDHLKCTADEFYERMLSRFDVSTAVRRSLEQIMGSPIFRDYFDYYIFGYHNGSYHYDSNIGFIDFLRQDRLNRTSVSLYYKYFAYALPVFIAFFVLWSICASRQKGSRRLPYLAFIGISLALFPELFISTDVLRWMSATLTCQFALLFAVYRNGDPAVRTVLCGSGGKAFVRRLICLVCAAVYIAVMMHIGRALPVMG